MTKLYGTFMTIVIKVEADDAAEAKRTTKRIADDIARALPIGASLKLGGALGATKRL